MTISRSSALPINLLLIFDMPDLNDALSLSTKSFSALSFLFTGTLKDLLSLLQQQKIAIITQI